MRRYVGFAAPRVARRSAIVKFVIVPRTPPNVIMHKITLRRSVSCYIRDVARCEITVHARKCLACLPAAAADTLRLRLLQRL